MLNKLWSLQHMGKKHTSRHGTGFLQNGQLLIELLVAIGVGALIIPALLSGFIISRQGKAQQEQRLEAALLAREAVEAVRAVRSQGWQYIATNGEYHPVVQGSTWVFVSGPETIGTLTRTITISDVYRDGSGAIVSTGGELDPSTKAINVTVDWSTPSVSSLTEEFFLSRFGDNATINQTTQVEFDTGTLTDTVTTNLSGGEVILAAGGHGDWCRPGEFVVEELDLPQSAAARAVRAIEGKAFAGTDFANTGVFSEISVSNESPPVANVTASIAGYDTNDIFIDTNYAYIATDDSSRDVVIVDLNTNQEVGYYNAPWYLGTAQGIYVVGNTGYVTVGAWLQTFDLTSKTGSRSGLDTEFLWGTGRRLHVINNYAYVAVDWGSAELRVINVSNRNNLSSVATANVNGEFGREVYANETGTRAYLATTQDNSKPEFFIINTTNKSGSMPIIGSYDSGSMHPTGVSVVSGNKALLVGTGGEEYQVIDLTSESSPQRCGGVEVNSGIYGVSSLQESDGDAYSYIVTGDTSAEFKIIEGGVGGSQYVTEGTFESSTIDPGYSVAYNRFIPEAAEPGGNTDIRYQVGIADAASGSCTGVTYSFVGPDGTDTSYFESEGPIPFDNDSQGYENPGRCFRYRVYLSTTDALQTPQLDAVTVNYSP
ncbi:hypothetical protein KBC79_00995 [Candidatus Woesebacteria bacterium]|nr:hypothetical protein [Candidatus Woesebacteria bacterium]